MFILCVGLCRMAEKSEFSKNVKKRWSAKNYTYENYHFYSILLLVISCKFNIIMWCDQAKWVWSRKIQFFFWHFLLGYCLDLNLVKTPQLGKWFQRNKQLKDWTNNKKQKKLSALFGCILKNSICEFHLILLDHITYVRKPQDTLINFEHPYQYTVTRTWLCEKYFKEI